ncbi:ribbon-helix-helix protein, CopG family [Streptomyces coeruleoprunus]|uniref:Ribbon-helix-helix protein, CopG family n=1 Tax=Streptomyces coeruleoprunus TaxID=285563 RepID=A0ABV9XNK5_9ACTN
MPRTRISISLDEQQAARIKRHAERAGMDVSAYLTHAATRQMAETEAIEEQFSQVDVLIAAAEAEAEALPTEPATSDELTEGERREVDEALRLVYGEEHCGEQPGRAG